MDYDVLILGGGIIGCAVSYELSKYNLNIALIEKDYDIANDVAPIDYSIVYDGLECEDISLSKLEFAGSKIMSDLASKFNIFFEKKGYLLLADTKEGEKKLICMYNKALNRGMENIQLLDGEEVQMIEPNLGKNIKKAIYSKNTGIISPYDLAISYGEIACDNGVNFKLGEEVLDIESISKGFKVVTNKNKFTCNMVLNTTPGKNYSIDRENKVNQNVKYLEYFSVEKKLSKPYNNIISTIGEGDNKTCIIPGKENKLLVGLKNSEKINCEEGLQKISGFIKDLSQENINDFYNSHFYDDFLIIDDSLIDEDYIKIIGKHYGQVTMTPAIANIVCKTVVNKLNCRLKKDFVDKRREFYKFRELSNEERKKIIKLNRKYGKVICYCNKVTEGEIIDAISRPLGARTIEGIKRRTGATFGDCRGTRCLYEVASILARETNKKMTDVVKDSKNSNIMVGRIKEFDKM
ncbi:MULTISPECIES: NAD(P)/FAD-dependent oxidoreductase [Clostridium]|uniref:Monomeric sarcosine oxidase n=1 Tax=Clostridium ragsdalei P11 TaxID=1353534 RepID=A0A1A6AU25_9CLOT|nr:MULTISPECIES: FAD-dependent oxidoreductase [Clostridium]OBR93543.1 monomeric sarcosine oxidase [Clostridium ragsdalei P11]QXE19294.1 FAD/NAD(P)-binding oxidoreductase [Clostridium sp. 001]